MQISLACDDASETAELQGRAAGVSAHVFSTPLTRRKGARGLSYLRWKTSKGNDNAVEMQKV